MNLSLYKNNWQKIICILLIICIGIGVILHIIPYIYNRSLWVDEAYLASSICTRNIDELASSPLDWGQSSSIGYLYIVKIFTMCFGTSETVLRIWSLITAIGCIALIYFLLKDKVKKHYALFFTAIFALTDKYIYYANELKPYMSDNFFCLLVLYIYQRYKDKKLPLWRLILYFSIIIWFSFSAVFFIAACMIIICISFLKKLIKTKDKKMCTKLLCCTIVLISFIANYILWLSKTANNAGGSGYWELLKFPLIPESLSDIKLIFTMIKQFITFYPTYIPMLFAFLFIIFVSMSLTSKKDKSNILLPFIISLLICLIASYIGFYPIQDRLVQVFGIVLLVFCAMSCSEIENAYFENINPVNKSIHWIFIFFVGILTGSLAIIGMSGVKNISPNHIYNHTSEVSGNIAYINNNVQPNDMVYVYRSSIPVYTYEKNYETTYKELKDISGTQNPDDEYLSGLPYIKNNTIYGQMLIHYFYEKPYSYEYEINKQAIIEDVKTISNYDTVYLFTSHTPRGIPELILKLQEYGTVEKVNSTYSTVLYKFSRK